MDSLKIQDFGKLTERYQALGLAARAKAVLADAACALQTAEGIVAELGKHPDIKKSFENVRKNHLLADKIRPSEAKTALLEAGSDFIGLTRQKLAAWSKTMERLSNGEGIKKEGAKEYIPRHEPIAAAIYGIFAIGSYLSILQLALAELTKLDAAHAAHYQSHVVKIRRCATLLCDCEHASAIGGCVQ